MLTLAPKKLNVANQIPTMPNMDPLFVFLIGMQNLFTCVFQKHNVWFAVYNDVIC